jgi:endogenous inhibitor of DNA gyrase (YacG/DUF329 family)
MPAMQTVKCKRCQQPFQARVADIRRGWGKFCSKSCKAIKQEQRTGQYADIQHRQRIMDANDGKSPRDFQKEHGGVPQFDNQNRYIGFTLGTIEDES